MECNFFNGQKVVCVNDKGWKNLSKKYDKFFPIINHVYTIREIICDDSDDIGVRLEEIHNPHPWGEWAEMRFFHWRFRPLVKKKTDISIFTDMLIKKPVKEKV